MSSVERWRKRHRLIQLWLTRKEYEELNVLAGLENSTIKDLLMKRAQELAKALGIA